MNLPTIQLGVVEQIPSSLTLSTSTPQLTTAGATAQLNVTAKYPDGSTKDVTGANRSRTSLSANRTRIITLESIHEQTRFSL